MEFRKLKASEIDVRVGGVYDKGITLLLYKDARCDMAILDETVGAQGWQRDHKEIKGTVYCGIGLLNNAWGGGPLVGWIWKWDAGSESNTEAEKGAASDSFKRACVNWGIGRELYTAPFIWINCKTQTKPNGYGYELVDRKDGQGFKVSAIEYDGGAISYLEIEKDGKTVYSYGTPGAVAADNHITPAQYQALLDIAGMYGEDENDLAKIVGAKHPEQYTKEDYTRVVMHYESKRTDKEN